MKKRVLSICLALCIVVTLLPGTALAEGKTAETQLYASGEPYAVEGGNIYFDPSSGTIVDCDTSVTHADIPNEINGVPVTSIGKWAFERCDDLTSVTIPNSVTSIGGNAFKGCDGLTSVTIPDNVFSIGEAAFVACRSLTSIEVDVGNPNYISEDGILFTKDRTSLITYPSGKQGAYVIPNSVTSIVEEAFYGCDSLTSVTIPSSVTSIGGWAFDRCSRLASVTILNSVTSIGKAAFQHCSGLTSVTIPSSVTSIESYAFFGCATLSDVYYEGTEGQWSTIFIDTGNDPLASATIHYNQGSGELPVVHSVTYLPNGGTWDGTIGESWEAGQTVDIPRTLPTKDGYTFGGWSDGTTTYQPGDTFTMPDHDVTLTAVWRAEFDYSVTYLVNGGTGDVPAAGYLAGQTVTITNKAPTKEGYVFDGWSDGSTIYQPGNTFEMPEHDVTLTAVWKEAPVLSDHSVTYRLNGGIGNMPAAGYLAGQTVTVTTRTPAKDGYTFAGWSDGTTTYQPGDTFTMPDHEVTLTAVWEEIFDRYLPFFEIARDSVTVPVRGTARPRVTTADGVAVTWTSDNPAIATVDSTGTVTGVSQGRTTVTGIATRDAQTKMLSYSVVVIAGVKITLKDHVISLKPNEETPLDYTALPLMMAGDDHVTYTSSDSTVATVSKHGTVHAVGGGTTTITATLKYGDSIVSDTCTVTVVQSGKKLAEMFVNKAKSMMGKTASYFGFTGSWCDQFIAWCSRETRMTGIVPGATGKLFYNEITKEKGGTGIRFYEKINGQVHRINNRADYKPEIGDIVHLTWDNGNHISHVGIVCEVKADGREFGLVHGNYGGGKVCISGVNNGMWFNADSPQIYAYARPNWEAESRTRAKAGVSDGEYNCPIDVRYTYDGEVLDSATGQMEASFGNMRLTDNGGILVHLNNYYDVDVTINGTGTGTMDITSTFRDEDGTTSVRKFQGVPITEDTIGKLYAYDSASTEILEMYNNYGKTFVNAWAASGDETVSSANAKLTDWYINGDSDSGEPTNPGPANPDSPGSSSGGSSGSGGSSHHSGGGVPSVYSISVDKTSNGSVTVSPKPAAAHSTVTVTVKPESGYVLDTLTVTDQNGKDVKLTSKGTSKYTFIMPDSKVTVSAFFRLDGRTVSSVFSDVPAGYWAKGAIDWASANGYMKGLTGSVFNPEGAATRQQVWMILARLSGQSPSGMAEARIWAMNSGLSDGTNPGAPVTRQQMVTFLHRYCGMRGYPVSRNGDLTAFLDYSSASDYAKNALAWAVGSGIVTGTKAGTLNPGGFATRAQFAVVLKRFYEDDFSD